MPHKNIGYRPTWAEVNLRHLAYNFHQVKKRLSAQTKIMATVKADAYGHGLIPVARRLVQEGVDFLGVASIDEGIRLRKAAVEAPVLILGLALPEDIGPIFEYRLTPTVCGLDLATALDRRAKRRGLPVKVHLKVDTGMGRIGVLHQDAEELAIKISRLKFIRIEGIFTHFAFADLNQEFTHRQIGLFDTLVRKLAKSGINIPLAHAANSLGVLDYRNGHFNMVRPGLVIYGLHPQQNLKIRLRPVLSLKTRVVFIKRLPPGYGVSYGHAYVTREDTQIVTLPIGYGDGYPRSLSNQAPVLIHGKRFKVAGRVCMDQMMVDAGDLPAKVGDEVVLIGAQGKNKSTVEELSGLCATIPYEIVCGLGSRIPRVFIG